MKIFFNYDKNTPSQSIFFERQLPLIKKYKVTFTRNFKNADIIIIPHTQKQLRFLTNSEVNSIIKRKGIKIIIVKPHKEIDIRLTYKNNLDIFKSLFNRFFKSERDFHFPKILRDLDTTFICDNSRLERHFMSDNWKTLYLPLTYNSKIISKKNLQISSIEQPEIAFIGEITHLIEWIDGIKYLLNKKQFKKYKLKIISFGAVSRKKIEKKIGKDRILWGNPSMDIDILNNQLKNVVFAIVPHQTIRTNYEGQIKNRINPFISQPNDVTKSEKFSCNSGRNHLLSSLSIPFITSPIEDVLKEYKGYPSFLFIENNYQLYYAAKRLQDLELRNKLSKFIRENYMENFSPNHVIRTLFLYIKNENINTD
ncbi:hypothetical protein [Prochlorococcus marinus]|uniref:hypothetical protein n=1 Tax=Prochlorococcus marinus TaxID=1219 RepID=UPI001AD99CB6|nr:hypothetical protein [Prochlorococcus marinus]MBO8217692.1 hypothetical protein [Prochlorococcus marinus XMU1405]MBW3040855.1 hypothetical protein [Prochlorococcus marinus str. MU1405]MBW3048315.1 hypothetical protein [Prochlorococcus marinus str. MU1406]